MKGILCFGDRISFGRGEQPAQGFGVSEKIGPLKLLAADGKMRLGDCAHTKTLFRIIQSMLSPRAEPFKNGKQVSTKNNYLNKAEKKKKRLEQK